MTKLTEASKVITITTCFKEIGDDDSCDADDRTSTLQNTVEVE